MFSRGGSPSPPVRRAAWGSPLGLPYRAPSTWFMGLGVHACLPRDPVTAGTSVSVTTGSPWLRTGRGDRPPGPWARSQGRVLCLPVALTEHQRGLGRQCPQELAVELRLYLMSGPRFTCARCVPGTVWCGASRRVSRDAGGDHLPWELLILTPVPQSREGDSR